ncbi:AI-2E family transporter [Haloferax namakaokahaiae]|uniref:AI-2E family transporter n=1 Tax=Haloferax namakaokahaiae TaxID=1748331 RepID=A0ABD5ZD92_9EURY
MATERIRGDSLVGPLRNRRYLWWWAFGLLLLGVTAWIGYNYVGWIVFGLFTYYVGRPITRWIQRYISSRTIAAALTLAFIIVPIIVFLSLFLGVALNQALQILSSDAATALISRLQLPFQQLPSDPVDAITVILQDPTYTSLFGQVSGVAGALATTLFNVFLMLIFAFFLLIQERPLSQWFQKNIFGTDSLAVEYLRSVDRGLTSVFFGYTLTIFVIMILAAVIYGVFNFISPGGIRIPYAILLAVVTGVFTLIPLVGRSVVYAFIVAIMAAQVLQTNPGLLWIPIVFFALMVLVFDNVVRTYIRPALSGKSYNMALVMFAYLLGPALFGWYGIFMGPLLMVVIVEFVTKVMPRFAGVEPEEPVEIPPEVGTGGGSPVEFGDFPDADRGDTPAG